MTSLAIHGAAGRMGRRLVALASEDPKLRLAAAIEHAGNALLGQDAGLIAGVPASGVLLAEKLPAKGVDVLIDFTIPAATRKAIQLCVDAKVALVIGTTGLTPQDHAAIDAAGATIPVLQAPNMSLGVNLLFALAAQVAKKLGDDYDIEIVEGHHRFKKDSPSGTALGIAQAICDATGKDIDKDVVHGRHGDDTTRKRGEIGMHALRLGDVVGDHTVSFGALGERLELTHLASSRDVFARGALQAAKWLAGKPAGRYRMADVLGL
ncbi:MAG: 4-hydroxy-tetrahydrodipicolinate reductase [Planctomycetota bacterium]|nr:4-hydroxy-tetrahydrodipicolinate reductase [Planctomycetota bacterium]